MIIGPSPILSITFCANRKKELNFLSQPQMTSRQQTMTTESTCPYRHIIWDWNGTLIDDAKACYEILSTILRKTHKPPIPYETYLQEFDFPIIAYYERLGFDFSVESYDDIAADYIALYADRQFRCNLRESAVDVLASIQKLGIGQSVLSAYNQTNLAEIISFFDIRDYFTKVVGRDDHYASGKVTQGKHLVQELGLAPAETLLVGDTTHDCEVAQALSIDCLLIAEGHQCREKLEPCGVPIIESLRSVLTYLSDPAEFRETA